MKNFFLLYVLIFSLSCNNSDPESDNLEEKMKEPGKSFNEKRNKIEQGDDGRIFTWTEEEEKKFMIDCKKGFEKSAAEEKLDDICTCILKQSKKYYKNYRQMEQAANDDHDKEIIAGCFEGYDEETE